MTGQHRRKAATPRRGLTAALAVVALGVSGWLALRGDPSSTGAASCITPTTLNVTVAPELGSAISTVAGAWNAAGTVVDGTCVRVAIATAAPSAVAAAVASRGGVTVPGLGKPNGTQTVPDVWVPDSSMWLSRLALASATLDLAGTSVAFSPVVVAVPQPVAEALAAKLGTPSWPSLLGQLSNGTIRAGIVDPDTDATGLSTLLAVGQAAAGGAAGGASAAATSATAAANAESPAAPAALAGAMRTLAAGDSMVRDDLISQFPRSSDESTIARSLGAAPMAEQAVLDFDAARPPVPLVALYLDDPAPPALDYPYTIMGGSSATKADAARELARRLAGAAWRDDLARAGLRAADGTFGAAMPRIPGMPAGPLTAAAVPPASIDAALSTWSAVTVPGRMLAVIDVSGSMAATVPSAKGHTRERVTIAAATAGLGLVDDRWEVGLWTFSTALDGTRPYRQLVAIEPLSRGRAAIQAALGTIAPKPQGDTGLYDTVLAAYRTVQAGWDPGRVNSVVIMTDGQNDDPEGISMSTLLATIKAIKDPDRPIQVIIIGIGDEVDKAELMKITDATGGGVFIAADPSTIDQIFLEAIALRPAADK